MKAPILFSLRSKFALIAALIVAFFSIAWGSHVVREEKAHLRHNLESSGRILLSSLKAPIINTMILQDMTMVPDALDNFVEEIVANRDLPTVYAYITDTDGRVLAHNNYEEFGKLHDDPMTRAALAGEGFMSRVVRDNRGEEAILDLAMPLRISGKCWGALRVGLSMVPMQREFLAFKRNALIFSVLLFMAGTVIFYIVGLTMSRPLERLSRTMSDIDLGAFEAKPVAPRRDEIGLLQKSFHAMLVRLRRSEQERQNALNCVIQNEKMATIGKIVAGVAHEVNNPLAAISACIYSLEGNSAQDPRTCMEILKAGIARIETIVRQLSDFSRVGSVELQYVPSDVFFRETEAFAVMALNKHNVCFVATDECLPPELLHIDKGKLHQVVLNLLLNAADASPEAGPVALQARKNGTSYVLTVSDGGAGIPPEEQERIFDIFFTTKPAGKGSGIGLAVCKSIVDLHRGTIGVESRPGETTFHVTIPLEKGVDDD